MSIVGSYNLDMRSTYQDTELMLAIDSEKLNSMIRKEAETDKTYSKPWDLTETIFRAKTMFQKTQYRKENLLLDSSGSYCTSQKIPVIFLSLQNKNFLSLIRLFLISLLQLRSLLLSFKNIYKKDTASGNALRGKLPGTSISCAVSLFCSYMCFYDSSSFPV